MLAPLELGDKNAGGLNEDEEDVKVKFRGEEEEATETGDDGAGSMNIASEWRGGRPLPVPLVVG